MSWKIVLKVYLVTLSTYAVLFVSPYLQIFRVMRDFITFAVRIYIAVQYPLRVRDSYKPDNIIIVPKEKSLRVFPRAVNDTNPSHKIHYFFRTCVV